MNPITPERFIELSSLTGRVILWNDYKKGWFQYNGVGEPTNNYLKVCGNDTYHNIVDVYESQLKELK